MHDEIIELNARIRDLEIENEQLKLQQIEINTAKELYLKIFDEFPALIWRARLDKLCDYFNKTWLDFTGRTMEQEFGNGWAESVHPDDFDFCLKTYVTAFDAREPFLMEYRMKNSYGEYRWIRDYGRPFYDLDDSFSGYIGSCYDITDAKNTEIKLTESNNMKDTLFAILAHDLRTPFNSLVGFSTLLLESFDTLDRATALECISNISIASNNTVAMLEELLLWGNALEAESGFRTREHDCRQLVETVARQLELISKGKGISVSIDVDPALNIEADPEILKTVLRNLIGNALKFTPRDGRITVVARRESDAIMFMVSDSGPGIDDSVRDSIWNSVERKSMPGTEQEIGTGVGLAICKVLVERHGGTISFESRKGEGTDFIFRIPQV